VVIGVVAAGALFMVGDSEPATDAAALTAAGSPEIVTAAVPRLTPPTIAVQAQDVQPARKVAARAGRTEAQAPVTTWTPPVEEPAKPVTPAAHPAVATVAAPSTQATPTSAVPAAPLAVETTPAAHLPQNLPGPIAPGPAEAVAPVTPAQAAPTTTAAQATPTLTVTQASPAAASQVPTAQAPAPAPLQQPPAAPVNPFDIFASLP
jgi:hypothetical protein